MQFNLSTDQALLQDALRKWFAGEYGFESRKRGLESEAGYSDTVWRELAAQGALSLGLPAAHGGFGGTAEIAIAMELAGRHLLLEPYLSTVVIGGGLVGAFGSAAQQESLLPAMAAGDCRIAYLQPENGECIARRQTDGWSLSGEFSPVLDGALADWLIVPAREGGAGKSAMFLLPSTAQGIERRRYRTHDGRSAADIRLSEAAAPATSQLGAPGQGDEIAERAEALAIPALCAEAVGIMDALIETTLAYLQSRTQFGQPIGRFQALQHRLADMFVMATQARSMSLLAHERAASADRPVRRRALSAAKAYVDKAARYVGQNAVQLHGGMGMTAELIVSHYFKRLTLIGATFGDRAHHLGVVSDAILAESA